MPRRDDITKILIIGSGPIVIGQACEFDYSGTQACKALREEGYEVVLVNSNPATIMTDPDTADSTYIEPLTWQMIEKIIAKEKPDALLPTLGGQTGLNCAMDLEANGVLEKYGVEMIGANAAVIAKAEELQSVRLKVLCEPNSTENLRAIINDTADLWQEGADGLSPAAAQQDGLLQSCEEAVDSMQLLWMDTAD